MNLREQAKQLMLRNYVSSGRKYIPPNPTHYKDQWLWDSCFHAIICAELGLIELAKNEVEKLLKWQRKDGWIPHQIYRSPKRKRSDLERPLYKKEHNRFHSSITQPAVMAQAVEAINDLEWTKKILPALIKFYGYFIEKQDPDGDGLIAICHPCESGRDSSPEFDVFKWRGKKGSSFWNFNLTRYQLSKYKLELGYKIMGWDIERIWKKDCPPLFKPLIKIFNIEDLMFHCIWVDGLRSLTRLCRACQEKEKAQKFKRLADYCEKAVYNLCWDKKDKIFYSLDSKNQKIKRKTVSNLFPLILDNIPTKMLRALVKCLTNPREFWTPYPIPSTAKNDPEFDPNCETFCNWRGPTWINANWFIVRGLAKHGYWSLAREIAEKTQKMIEKEGIWEFYNPITGKGLRETSRNFGWSTLVITFPKILKEARHKNVKGTD